MSLRVCLFAYDFPHRKSSEFLTRLVVSGFDVAAVIAAPWVPLKSSREPVLPTKPNRIQTITAAAICTRFDIPYFSVPHDDEKAVSLVQGSRAEVGVIGGARILKGSILSALPFGIVNFHPGLIPEARGLDSLKWSIYEGIAPGVTAHLIDERIDAGRIILRRQIQVHESDSLMEVGLRIEDTQVELLEEVLHMIEDQPDPSAYALIGEVGPTLGAMPENLESELLDRFVSWKTAHRML